MLAILGLVNAMLLISVADVLTQTIGYQYIEVTQRGERDFFVNPERSCDKNACWEYQSTIVGGKCESDSCCTCRCQGENTTYVEHTHQCMSFASIRGMVMPQTVIGKFMNACLSIQSLWNQYDDCCDANPNIVFFFTTRFSL